MHISQSDEICSSPSRSGTNAGGSMGGLGLSLIPFQLSLLDKVHICNNFLLTRMSTPLFMASRSSNSILMDLQKI